MKMFFCHTLAFLFGNLFVAFGQTNQNIQQIRRNTISIEFFGNAAILYNLTYERTFVLNETNKIATGIGFQVLPVISSDDLISVSPQISYFIGKTHHLETGVGVAYDIYSKMHVFPLRLGYRYQQEDEGFFFKLGYTPLLVQTFSDNKYELRPWAGISFGRTF